ncbi:MAG: hypothetical protein QM582_01210 [Micropruina sp.]|uniref:hypothetical protein n=1 Tax=Micropruina sp. TaxID=2737536 RepID=UPI0039E6200C
MVLLDLADASWFPLLMVVFIGGVMYLLYRSMRHEIGKIRVPRRDAESPESPAEQ